MQLRQYQLDALEKVRVELRKGLRAVLLVMATGGGKTPTISYAIRQTIEKMSRRTPDSAQESVLFLAHRKELISQASAKLDRFGVDHGVIMANHPRNRPHAIVQVASVQTLARRIGTDRAPKRVSLIVVDEAHHSRANSYQKIFDAYPEAIILGATATPWRADGKGLGEVFDAIVIGARASSLIRDGWLVPFEGFGYEKPDLSSVTKRAGDYALELIGPAMEKTVLGGGVIRDYLANAKGKRALAFACNVAHSKAVVEQALAAGIPAAHVDDNTPDDEREALLGPGGKLERGEVMFVSNCMICTEGTDIPSIECVILMRPTMSLAMAMQMMGRGLRIWCFNCRDATKPDCVANGHHVKTVCRIHDHANVLEDNGLPDEDFPMSLDMDRPPRPKMIKTCPNCKAMFAAGPTECPRCGQDMSRVEGRAGVKDVHEHHAAERLTIDEIRRRREDRAAELEIDLSPLTDDQLMKVHRATQEQKAAEFLRLERVRSEKGFKPGFSANQYRAVFGVWPKFTDEYLAGITPATRPFVPWRR